MYNKHQNVSGTPTNPYTCTDLNSTAALVATGFTLINLDRTNPSRVVFVFDDSNQLQQALDDYWSGKLTVDAKAYSESMRWLKSRIYNG